jgi:hypothetical protein
VLHTTGFIELRIPNSPNKATNLATPLQS